MARIASNLSKLGLVLRGSYGEGSQSIGAYYQLSNQITLGLSEKEAVDNLDAITAQLIDEERKARERLSKSIVIQDKIDRASGVLKTAKLLSYNEFMELISYVRFGLSVGMISGVTAEELNGLSLRVQPATLMAASGKPLDQNQRDVLRAQLVRQVCAQIKE